MLENFLNINKEKQDRILNASIEEFAHSGYDNASTNNIVKEAGISKGLLFHYFTDKKTLYLYLFDYFIKLFIDEMYSRIDLSDNDLFRRLNTISKEKLNIIKKYPHIYKFLERAYLENSDIIKPEIEAKVNIIIKENNKIFFNIDYAKFRENIDVSKAVRIILWSLEGFGNSVAAEAREKGQVIDYTKAFAELDIYFDILKKCFYKEEEII